jgi:hypothetical protein
LCAWWWLGGVLRGASGLWQLGQHPAQPKCAAACDDVTRTCVALRRSWRPTDVCVLLVVVVVVCA